MNKNKSVIIYCPICENRKDNKFWIKKNGYNIYACGNCDTKFIHPQPNTNELIKIYDKDYFNRGQKYKVGESNSKNNSYNHQHHTLQKRINTIMKIIPNGRILDIGCATGEFLRLARENGYEVCGVEISEFSANYARKYYNLNIVNSNLLSANLTSSYYDVVTMWDVIEHLPDPRQTICEINRILKPGGLVMFSTGDISSFYAKMLNRFWHLLTPPQHLFFFSKKSIKKLLSNNGFELEKIYYSGKYTSIEFILFKANETYGKIIKPLAYIASVFKLKKKHIYFNICDIMTCIAFKKI